jgi:RNA polymerase sigma-70 factor (ECF subfamily)
MTAGQPLAERRRRFEREALEQLDGLYAFALRLTRSRHDAEDLVSDTILRALDRWTQYELGTNIRAWLFTILYHLFINRRHRLDRELPLEHDDARARLELVGDPDPEGRYFDSLIDERITRAVEALPEHYRAAVVLGDVHGFRYAELAEILGIPEGTAKSRLFRARRLLRKELAQYAVELGYSEPRAA